MSVHELCLWLSRTPLSVAFQSSPWIVAATQTVHILGVALVFTSAMMISLKLLGLAGRELTGAAYTARFTPWIWSTLPVLLLSGVVLIISEPARSIENPAFLLKMGLLVAAVAATLVVRIPLRRDPAYWETTPAHRRGARVMALLSLALWMATLSAGRWIGYVDYA